MSNHRRRRRHHKPRIRRRSAPGTRPGTITVAPDALPTTIEVMAFDRDRLVEEKVRSPGELQSYLDAWPVVWINFVGLGSQETLQSIGEAFHLHPLAMEDVVSVHQRAKIEPYHDNVFIVLRMPSPSGAHLTEQLSIFLGRNWVITFQVDGDDPFGLLRAGLRKEHGGSREGIHADYLAYRLIDAVVDAYFPVLEKIGDRLDELDDHAIAGEAETAFSELHVVKGDLLALKRAVWPLRDAVSELRAETTPFVSDKTRVYLRDCYDHAVQLIDLLETYRDITGDLRDFFMSMISNRMNEIMKTLTIISTVFLPLSFIAGVYGMNFDRDSPWNMPELGWMFGYPFALALMAALTAGMLYYFLRRGWLKRDPTVHVAGGGDHSLREGFDTERHE